MYVKICNNTSMITYAVSIHFYQNVNEIIASAVISIAEVNWKALYH